MSRMSVPPRGPLWQRWLERGGVDRNPVSLTRQRAGIALFAAILLAISWYLLTTRDAAIRERAVSFLQEMTSGEVQVGSARFRMFGGITLQDVYIATPFDARLDPSAKSPTQREIFSARSLQLVQNPWLLLLGKLRVEEIVAVQPRITLVQNADTGMRNWQLLTQSSATEIRGPRGVNRPEIRVRAAKAVVVSIQEGAKPDTRVEELDADIRPHPHSATGYYIEVRRFSEPAERTTVVFDPTTRLVTNTPFVDAQTIRLQLPKAAQQFFDRIHLRGEVKLNRLVYDPGGLTEGDTEIRLRKVQCRLPLSLIRSGNDPRNKPNRATAEDADSFVTMTDVEGKLQLRRDKLDVRISGQVNGGVCQVEGILEAVGGPLGSMGIDIHLIGDAVPAPEGDLRSVLIEDTAVPKDLRTILVDYDPHGPFDFDFHLRRPPGPAGVITTTGALEAVGITAMSRIFAYPIDHLYGRVRFEGPMVYIDELHGRHQAAGITVKGSVDQSREWSAVHLDIEGKDVPLNSTLLRALSPRHQHAWMRFTPQGDVNLSIRMRRAGGDVREAPPAYRTHVTAMLQDNEVSLKTGAYWLTGVGGRLEMDEDRIEFHGLCGRHDEGRICIDGFATIPENSEPEMDLCIEGKHIRLDEELAEVLPPEGRGAFAQFQAQGYLDLNGSIQRLGAGTSVEYDLNTSIYDGVLSYLPFPYEISDVQGEVNIRTRGVSILRVRGTHGPAEIELSGDVMRRERGFAADLNFTCRKLPIDAALYRAFPQNLRRIWHMFEPQGTAHVSSTLHYETDDQGSSHRHRTQMLIENGSALFSGFPLPLRKVNAEIALSEIRADLMRVEAEAGGGNIHLDGTLDLSTDQPAGVFNLTAKGLHLGEPLFRALPASIGGSLRGMNAKGELALHLAPLRFEPSPQGPQNWEFAGKIQLRDVAADLGMELREAIGVLEGQGRVDSQGHTELDVIAKLDAARCAGWDLQRINTHVVLPRQSSKLEIRDAIADAYGGEVAGFATIDLGKDTSAYQGSITAREVRLDRYLEQNSAKTASGVPRQETVRQAQGKLSGNMFIRGRTGQGGHREGAGEMYVRSAQVWKLPLVFAIFQVLNLTPDENVFHDGHLKYYLADDILTFNEIDLQGKAVSFIGGGKMDLKTRALDVTLLAGSPLRLKIPFLSELLERASREFMEVRIRGTLEHPQIQPQPLKSLKKTLETVFPPRSRNPTPQTVTPSARRRP